MQKTEGEIKEVFLLEALSVFGWVDSQLSTDKHAQKAKACYEPLPDMKVPILFGPSPSLIKEERGGGNTIIANQLILKVNLP